MNIHESENILEDNIISSKNNDISETKLNDNLENMNPYNETIHSIESNENNSINIIEEKPKNIHNNILIIQSILMSKFKQQQYIKQQNIRRNDIMRSVAKERYSQKPNNVKQLFSRGKHAKHHINYITCHVEKNPIRSFKTQNNDLVPNKKLIYQSIKQNEISVTTSENLLYQPVPHNDLISIPITPNEGLIYQPVTPIISKPTEINLPEILTDVLQEVIQGKINSIDNIIGKLRTDFEEKNVITSSKKRNIMLLNFEDDTMRPVLKIDEKYMTIIEKWYSDCDLLIDIEETNVSIPEVITFQDVSGVLFQDINYKFKDEYLNSYIPLIINNIISERTIKCFEKKYFNKTYTTSYPIEIKNYSNFVEQKLIKNNSVIADNILSQMGIIIPENIKPEQLKPKNEKNNLFTLPWMQSNIELDADKRIDPEILIKNNILADIKNKPNVQDIEVFPYNNIFEPNIYNKDFKDCVKIPIIIVLMY